MVSRIRKPFHAFFPERLSIDQPFGINMLCGGAARVQVFLKKAELPTVLKEGWWAAFLFGRGVSRSEQLSSAARIARAF
jgi:hypothetical protein